MVNLPTAADIDKLPESFKAKIARASRNKGSNYERTVGKKLANYFGISDWNEVCYRTKPHGHAQPDGDLKLINQVGMIWRTAGLGPVECKYRREWAFAQFFKTPEKSKVYGYWTKSNGDTKKDNSVIIFTKAGVPDFVFCLDSELYTGTILRLQINDLYFAVQTFPNFLTCHWPDPKSVL